MLRRLDFYCPTVAQRIYKITKTRGHQPAAREPFAALEHVGCGSQENLYGSFFLFILKFVIRISILYLLYSTDIA